LMTDPVKTKDRRNGARMPPSSANAEVFNAHYSSRDGMKNLF
jgi:hypothetical protein